MRSILVASVLFACFWVPSGGATACAAGGPTSLSQLDPESANSFYSGVEGDLATTRTIGVHQLEDGCNTPSTIILRLQTATAGEADIDPFQETLEFTGLEESERQRPAVINGDDATEPIEHGIVDLQPGENAYIVIPSRAPLYVIDDDGSSRVSFGESALTRIEYDTRTVAVPIFRSGPATSTETATVSLNPSSTAEATDYTGSIASTVTFEPGERLETVNFTIVNDNVQSEGSETLVLDLEGASAVEPSTFTFTIVDNDTGEITPPRTRFHHPKHGVSYDEDFWKVFEYHVYAKDNDGGTGLETVQMALKKKLRSGDCKWWNKQGWENGSCRKAVWVGMKANPKLYPPKENGELLHIAKNPDGLTPSAGTKVKEYTIYSRARDAGGNLETDRDVGRNKNTFEVRPVAD